MDSQSTIFLAFWMPLKRSQQRARNIVRQLFILEQKRFLRCYHQSI
jgi:hypothetical protein